MEFDKIRSLTSDDEETFQLYKTGIEKAVRETFSSLPADFEAKAVGVNVRKACGLHYTYMIVLPDGRFAKVNFSVGGDFYPGTEKPELKFGVDPEPHVNIST